VVARATVKVSVVGLVMMSGSPTVSAYDAMVVWSVASVSVIANRYTPIVVGVPAIEPAALSVSPVGSCPSVSFQVYGRVPPVADREALYGRLRGAVGSVVVEITRPTVISIWRAAVALAGVEAASRTASLIEVGPAVVGLPVIEPAAEMESPLGRDPDARDQV